MSTTAHWDENKLIVHWYGAKIGDEAGILYPASHRLSSFINDPKRKTTGYKLVIDTFDDTMVRYYDEKPDAIQALKDLCSWQEQAWNDGAY